ncbi:hypothetical protein EU545_00790 [Candidatus Thorarchaeota archaeon]|nr:MAG: hypothetical protein EU545_00790 [Candidatus Thorarchaeota archaeon]
MLSAVSFKIYEMRRYLVLSLVISMLAIPIANSFVIQRDRNRNEMYGEAFWIYGFGVYNMTDQELAESLPEEWGFNDGDHVLPDYLGNITYEYPVFGLIFFSIATALFPGVNQLQPLWLNFLLVLVFNLNLVLIAILLKDRIYTENWARLFFGGYFVYGLIMSAGGGKLEPIVDCLLLMALVLRQEEQMGKAMFTLGLAVQTKIYPAVAFPLFFLDAPMASIWFFISALLTVIPFAFAGVGFESLIMHFLNTSSYSAHIVNTLYPGLAFATPDLTQDPITHYPWPPALIPLVLYVAFFIYTVPLYLPTLSELRTKSWRERIDSLVPLYVYMLPTILFVFRWVMPWYLFWMGIMIFFFERDKYSIGYLKEITVVGLLYSCGLAFNWPYFISAPLHDFLSHFTSGWYTIIGVLLMILVTIVSYFIWKVEIERREKRAKAVREAEERGELII